MGMEAIEVTEWDQIKTKWEVINSLSENVFV